MMPASTRFLEGFAPIMHLLDEIEEGVIHMADDNSTDLHDPEAENRAHDAVGRGEDQQRLDPRLLN